MGSIGNVSLEELLFELRYHGVEADFNCGFCKDVTPLEILEFHPLGYKIRCGCCRGTTWGGKRYDLLWKVTGFDGSVEIYNEHVEMAIDAIHTHLQQLARQHSIRGDTNRPDLLDVRRNHDDQRLSFICGVDPYYVAVTIGDEE